MNTHQAIDLLIEHLVRDMHSFITGIETQGGMYGEKKSAAAAAHVQSGN
ncbi:MAG: hypothetical protein LBP19_03955 [Treponema sp.]|jgi:hypothetical protein|nr:hypothetical protein [Treponema sp.]